MKRFRLVFFNPVSCNKRVYTFEFSFDPSNHGWDLIHSEQYGIYKREPRHDFIQRMSPEEYIEYAIKGLTRTYSDEYMTLKTY